MSKALEAFKANHKDLIAQQLAENKEAASLSIPKITAKNHVFTLPNGKSSKPDQPIEVVVIDYARSHAYFEKEVYDASNIQPPTCSATGKVESQMIPSGSNNQNSGGSCLDCPHNQFGTSFNGKGKRCSQGYSLVVIAPDGQGETMILKVPAASMKTWQNYVAKLTAEGTIPALVVTEISFVEGVDYNKFKFKSLGEINDISVVEDNLQEAQLALTA